MITIFKFFGIILFYILVFVVCTFAVTWIFTILAGVLAVALLAWVLGFPISVTENGKKVGYFKRTKYHSIKGSNREL